MSKLSKFFFEEVENDRRVPLESNDFIDEESSDVNIENISEDSIITDIYTSNDMSDFSKSIFKIDELLSSLPKEMPNDTKRNTVMSILNSFGLAVDEVVEDGCCRATLLTEAFERLKSENEAVIQNNEELIEQKKIEIQSLEKDNSDRSDTIRKVKDSVENEIKKITELVTFVKGE